MRIAGSYYSWFTRHFDILLFVFGYCTWGQVPNRAELGPVPKLKFK
jgi:hypothetical protein